MSEAPPIRIRPLTEVLNGADAAGYILALIDTGYDRFYVRVPDGFHCEFEAPWSITAHRRCQQAPQSLEGPSNNAEPTYLQLDRHYLQNLVESTPFTATVFNTGALFLRRRKGGLPSIDYDRQGISIGLLQPNRSDIADATPLAAGIATEQMTIVKAQRPNSTRYNYSLHGVTFRNIYLEDAALAKPANTAGTEQAAVPPAGGPDDPYRLEASSPLLFAILDQACRLGNAEGSEISLYEVAKDLERHNSTYPKNPKPFNSKRMRHAKNLANPRYDGENRRDSPERPPHPKEAPDLPFFSHSFINANLAKVLYAAACWNNELEPILDRDNERLVELLVDLEFWDRDEEDEVQSYVFFITGAMYQRNKVGTFYRHEGGSRK